ncbi:MAG: AAA family ATPase [Thermaerobacter sp.]|nr:AAA family ATPase [Thermaerobacter sp.]
MRINRLKMAGVRHDLTIDLDLTGDGGGIYIIRGPNEAGKSTLLNVLVDVLYGGVIHDGMAGAYDTQTVLEAWLSHRQEPALHITRKRRRKSMILYDTRLDDDAIVGRYLGGYDRERFTLLFGFDHDRLRTGGQGLMQSGGHAGVSLFEAGGGIQHLHTLLKGLDERSSKILEPSFRKNASATLNKSLKQYHEARKALREASLKPETWHSGRLKIEQMEQHRRKLESALEQKQTERASIARAARVRGHLNALHATQRALKDMESVYRLSPESIEHIAALVKRKIELAKAIQEEEQRVDRIRRQKEAVPQDPLVLPLVDDIMALSERVSQYEEEKKRRPQVTGEIGGLRQHAQNLAHEIHPGLTLQEVQTLSLPMAVKSHVKELANNLRSAQDEHTRAHTRHEEALNDRATHLQELKGLGERPDVSGLKRLIDDIHQEGRLEATLSDLQSQAVERRRELEASLRRQPYWTGDLDAFATLPVPSLDDVARFSDEISAIHERLREIDRDAAATADAREKANQQLERVSLNDPAPLESELEAARTRRDWGWVLVKRVWLEGETDSDEVTAYVNGLTLPETYEEAARTADQMVDRMRREADKTAERAQITAENARLDRRMVTLEREQEIWQRKLDEYHARWNTTWDVAGIAPGDPKDMERFLTTVRQPILDGLKQLNHLQHECSRLAEKRDGYQRSLADMGRMLNAGWPQDAEFSTLKTLAETCLAEAAEAAERQQTILAGVKEIDRRIQAEKSALDRSAAEIGRIEAEWQSLKADYPSLPVRLQDTAPYLDAADQLIERMNEVSRREAALAQSERVIEEFEDKVRTLASRLAYTAVDITDVAPSWVRGVRERLRQAMQADQQIRQLSQWADESRVKLDSMRADLDALKSDTFELYRKYECPDDDALLDLAEKSRTRRALEQQYAEQEALVKDVGDGLSLEELQGEMDQWRRDIGLDALDRRRQILDEEINALEEEHQKAIEELAGERAQFRRWDGSDTTAAIDAGEAEAHWTDVERAWNEYLRVELARRILARAIEEFRDKNQSTVLDRATAIFRRLTLDRYRRIDVGYEGTEAYLELVMNDRERRRVDQLSDGTLDQLFLSLRLAFIALQHEKSDPLPLIMDDIMVHFDDQRTEATFEVLADMARHTQILYFTHHDAVADIASRAAHQMVSLHDMGDVVRAVDGGFNF